MFLVGSATLVQKSYCYTPGVGVCMQNVRANVKVMKFQSLCIFSCILTLLMILIKPRTTKAHDRRASGDCGTSGCLILWMALFSWVPVFCRLKKKTHSWVSKFVVIIFPFTTNTKNAISLVLEFVDWALHENHENWYRYPTKITV